MKDKAYYESLDKRTLEYKNWKNNQEPIKRPKTTSQFIEKTPNKGLGDIIEGITKATGIKNIVGDCEGCNERKDKANLLGHKIEYLFKKHKPNEFNEEDIEQWNEFLNRKNQNKIDYKQQNLIVRLLKDILNMSVKPCSTCSGSVWLKYIDMIQLVYDKNSE